MSKIKIYVLLLIVMLFWGLNLVALKVLVSYFSPFVMTGIRIFIAGICVLIILAVLKKLVFPQKQHWKWILIASILGVVFHHLLLSIGLTKTTAVNGGIILGFSPLLTAILALIFGFNKFNFISFAGFILGAFGVSISVLNGGNIDATFSFGDLMIFLSILSQAFSFLIIKKVSESFESVVLTGYMLLIGSFILIAISLIVDPSGFTDFVDAPIKAYVILIGSALFATAIGHMVYNFAISKIGPAETAIFGNFNTVFGLIGSAILLNEAVTSIQIVGCICIIIGVLFGTGTIEAFVKSNFRRV